MLSNEKTQKVVIVDEREVAFEENAITFEDAFEAQNNEALGDQEEEMETINE